MDAETHGATARGWVKDTQALFRNRAANADQQCTPSEAQDLD